MRWVRPLLPMLVIFLSFNGCSRRDPEAERRAAISSVFTKLRSCAPGPQSDEAASNLRLAVESVTVKSDETSVRLIAYALNEPADFDLPVYSLSRGKWLIDEKRRTYLLDEQCREYKLKDRKSSAGQAVPQNGKVTLNSGQAFSVTLSFPRLQDQTQIGVLVYGDRALPFTLWNNPR